MSESGISLDFDSLLEMGEDPLMSDVGSFYEIKSQPVLGSPAEVKNVNSMATRTNLKQQIQKQHMQELERKEQQQNISQSLPKSQVSPTNAISMPPANNVEVPAQVFHVKTKLENPTKYHVQQNQKRQVEMYISESLGKPSTMLSLPIFNSGIGSMQPQGGMTMQSSSAPTDPDSPLSMGMGSTHTSVSEMDDLLGDIISLESVDAAIDPELQLLEMNQIGGMAQTLPHSNDYNEFIVDGAHHQKSSASCPGLGGRVKDEPPPFMCNDDARAWAKERQKKDNHNIIERRRRFNINDRIKELGTLLPRCNDPDMRQNKGSILKASVDYISKLKRDQARMKQAEEKQRKLEQMNRKMLLKIQQLELTMKAHGINAGTEGQDSSSLISDMFKQQTAINLNIKPGQTLSLGQPKSGSVTGVEDLMDDSPVNGDPMMGSSPKTLSRRSSMSIEDGLSLDGYTS
ncbi:unnamed protein product [Owenia fusiformis]|uniref:Uncharacterized protein n=1 Tax=Owenia fusiformis TaxID=6347 RepID=A0A8J1XGD5_OWEFU|nr:unnamed protein product [Owenia fusiformis]